MTDTFSAGPQATGYLFQARYALYALLRAPREEAAIIIEGLDDIEVRDANSTIQLDQLKHHIRQQARLTNTSSDLWKTLRIWSEGVSNSKWSPDITRLHLVTTADAPLDSIAWYLRDGPERDEACALELLLKTIETSKTQDSALQKSFSAFRALSESKQKQLVHFIAIVDGAANILDLSDLIRQELKFATPTDSALNKLCESLEGWWFNKVVEHLLSGSSEPITQIELRLKIGSIISQYREDNLPTEYASINPDIVDPVNDNRTFVKQLKILDINNHRITKAIIDYYRAFEQRASWVRNYLVIDDDIARYEQRLIDEWETIRLSLEDDMLSPETLESDCKAVGRELIKWVERNANLRIRPHVEDRFVVRGSYHILADADEPRVWWHPKFVERITQLLLSSESS